ncbi:MAG: NAD(P)/FAD-dependent oxidoreductase [Deltaproteobacteria bacterium]|nr:NAD(P)/FAD-dependent oxidoreductase [Deltaproteobacteria bacterium]
MHKEGVEHLDVLIVGAGLSGIGAAYHLQTRCPAKSYAILEARESLGGTWDLFRYPGIRSDSDMFTLGYSFRPWTNPKAIADGSAILAYIRETAEAYGIDRQIRYRKRVERARWSSEHARWTVDVRDGATGQVEQLTCSFLFAAAGYYDYDEGYTPELPGRERFRGRVVHPQKWTPDIEWAGKRVVVIGSGATAVTLVPELSKRAAHVTMLQRSPTYVVSMPERDRIANWARAFLPGEAAYGITRWKNVLLSMAFFELCRRFPARAKRLILRQVKQRIGAGVDVDTHFTPRYDPWDQRLCLVPDGDLFESIRDGRVSVVTDHIESFTETGILLKSGRELPADLIVTATGLKLKLFGGIQVEVDGQAVDPSKALVYKGMMVSDVPNMAFAIGYTNASWTLKCDLVSEYVCRLLNHMDERGYRACVPRRTDPTLREEPLIDFSSGYVQRALDFMPKQGSRAPWKLYQNYALDRLTFRRGRVDDGVMEFTARPRARA